MMYPEAKPGIFGILAIWALVASAATGCSERSEPGRGTPSDGTASLLLLVSDELSLADNPALTPRIYELIVTPSSGTARIRKAGDLPAPGATAKVDGLPADPQATVTGALYGLKLHPSARTHNCASAAPVALIAGQSSSVDLTCTSTVDPGAQPIKVFVKVAAITLTVTTQDPAAVLGARDFNKPSLFATIDKQGRRISLSQDEASLTVHVGGDVTYLVLNDPSKPLPLLQLLGGTSLALTAVAGQQVSVLPEPATLSLSGAALLYEPAAGELAAVLPISLANAAGTVTVDGRLFEEPANREITVVSYNVENLFDQADEDRNAGYGDYRITPNSDGKSSNYGEPVVYDGQTLTWTDVKIAGIRKALTGIDPAGPEVVGLVEIESKAALDQLLAAMRDLGYQDAVFTEWTPDMTPTAIGLGLLTKLPVLDRALVKVATPTVAGAEASRPILKVTLDVAGHPLVVYVNHWKSKGGPESQRILYAEALEADIAQMVALNPRVDYIVLGDLNSEYNEKVIIEPNHNDAGGKTGINDTLKAQGDEMAVLKGLNPALKYNLHYELNKAARRTAWHTGHEWSALDHMIIGGGLYDQRGVTYIDGSFQPVTAAMPRLDFLFTAEGTTNRWRQVRESGVRTRHEVGGYSDHLPLVARFRVPVRQSDGTIWLGTAGKPDATDAAAP